MFFFKMEPGRILAYIGKLGEPIGHSQKKEYRRVCSHLDARFAFLDARESGPRDGGALGHRGGRNTSP